MAIQERKPGWLKMSSLISNQGDVGHDTAGASDGLQSFGDFVGVSSSDGTVADENMTVPDASMPQALCQYLNMSYAPVSVSEITRHGIVSENAPLQTPKRSRDTRTDVSGEERLQNSFEENVPVESDPSSFITADRHRSSHFGDREYSQRDGREVTNRRAHSDHVTSFPEHACHSGKKPSIDKTARNQLIVVSTLCFLFMVAEIVGGLLSHSLALVTDATHLASDLTSFLVSLFAVWLATKPATNRMTFGYHRAEVLGALISIIIIWIATGVLVYLAVKRIQHNTYDIEPDSMLITSGIGVAFNIVMAIVLHSGVFKKCQLPTSLGHNHSHSNHSRSHSDSQYSNHGYQRHINEIENNSTVGSGNTSIQNDITSPDRSWDTTQDPEGAIDVRAHRTVKDKALDTYKTNINIRAAVIHVIGDLIQSIGVLIAAVIIKVKPEYKIADPICTFVFSILVLFTTVTVLRDIGAIILEAVPRGIDVRNVKKGLSDVEGVRTVHSLRVWALTINKVVMAVHLGVDIGSSHQVVLNKARAFLHDKYHVTDCVIQVEEFDDAMALCPECDPIGTLDT